MEKLIQRLEKIFLGQFGCRLTFLADNDLVLADWDRQGLNDLRRGHTLFVRDTSGKRIGFAVHKKTGFAGLAVVSEIKGDENERLIDLAGFAVALLEDEVMNDTQNKPTILKRAEENLIVQENKKNIVPLRPTRSLIDDPFTVVPEIKSTITSTLIMSKDGFPFQRLAVDVHVRSGRVALLSPKDLAADALSSVQAIRELGSITLFIEDITKVSVEQQALLAEYLQGEVSEDTPVLLVCATGIIEDMIIDGKLNKDLSTNMMCVRIPWNPQDTDSMTVKKAVRIVIDGAESVKPETRYVPFHPKFLDEDQPTFH
jgi:hypothetical protein